MDTSAGSLSRNLNAPFTIPPMLGLRMLRSVTTNTSSGASPLSSSMNTYSNYAPRLPRSEFGTLGYLAVLHDVMYYVRHGCVEAATLSEAEKQDSYPQYSEADVLKNPTIYNYIRFDTKLTYCMDRVKLSEDHTQIQTCHTSTVGTALCVPVVESGRHMWRLSCSDITSCIVGVCSMAGAGGDAFMRCREGSLPPYQVCLRPGARSGSLEIRWLNEQQVEETQPVLLPTTPMHTDSQEVCIYLDFIHKLIAFYIDDQCVGEVV
eukprot:PhF_6_TR36293/c0_g1_i3/m.52944